ncbi:MAG TPA: class I SAM-dependent methyltransferase [Lunatimonas sp.]|nr:class I SAM-dependent methyltransferase [Lunatimonas sp.]
MATYTTEITSDKLISDNPIHQRLLKAYLAAKPMVKGDLLEVGCGEGRGIEILASQIDSYLGLDKIPEVIGMLSGKFPDYSFQTAHIPPLSEIPSDTYDTVVSFQVIEHIDDDRLFLQELHRVLKPGGQAIISTPNINFSLSRNPWHVREYTPEQLRSLCEPIFSTTITKGISGNAKVMAYHEANRKSVRKFTRWDILNLQYRLPASVLKVPYEVLNRINRNALHRQEGKKVTDITHEDYPLIDDPSKALDLFYILKK